MATEIIYRETRRYQWPELQLNLWILLILTASATCLGIFSWFLVVQDQMLVGVPWYVWHSLPQLLRISLHIIHMFLFTFANLTLYRLFPFGIVTSSLSLLFLAALVWLATRRLLIPNSILLAAFILFVLWLTMLIETAIQLYGPAANVSGNCETYVYNQAFYGVSLQTLAYLTQKTICDLWRAAFAFEVVATVLYVWIIILAWQVQNTDDE
jgi:hypothetical protein